MDKNEKPIEIRLTARQIVALIKALERSTVQDDKRLVDELTDYEAQNQAGMTEAQMSTIEQAFNGGR